MGKIYVGGSLVGGVCAACVASCIGEARAFLWAEADVRDACEWDYTRLRVRRDQPLDILAGGLPAGVVKDQAALRSMVFSVEGDNTCASCGLYTMGGEFPLCPDCEQCAECGHAEDCEERP
jgi:hypothetical protein